MVCVSHNRLMRKSERIELRGNCRRQGGVRTLVDNQERSSLCHSYGFVIVMSGEAYIQHILSIN